MLMIFVYILQFITNAYQKLNAIIFEESRENCERSSFTKYVFIYIYIHHLIDCTS